MLSESGYHVVDLAVFGLANLVNVLLIGIFLSRPPGWRRLERTLGWIFVALSLPVTALLVLNLLGGREWWAIAMPALLLAFIVVEFVLDYWLELDFRHSRLLGPYLLLYYLALMGLIGYTFLIGATYGFVTLVTYFAQLGATAYSYRRVGHGTRPGEGTGVGV